MQGYFNFCIKPSEDCHLATTVAVSFAHSTGKTAIWAELTYRRRRLYHIRTFLPGVDMWQVCIRACWNLQFVLFLRGSRPTFAGMKVRPRA